MFNFNSISQGIGNIAGVIGSVAQAGVGILGEVAKAKQSIDYLTGKNRPGVVGGPILLPAPGSRAVAPAARTANPQTGLLMIGGLVLLVLFIPRR